MFIITSITFTKKQNSTQIAPEYGIQVINSKFTANYTLPRSYYATPPQMQISISATSFLRTTILTLKTEYVYLTLDCQV